MSAVDRNMARSEIANFRVTADEKAAIESASRRRGYRFVGDYMRTVVMASVEGQAAGGLDPADRQAMDKLAHQVRLVGRNLNQLLRRLNLVSAGLVTSAPTTDDIGSVMKRFDEQAREIELLVRRVPGAKRARHVQARG